MKLNNKKLLHGYFVLPSNAQLAYEALLLANCSFNIIYNNYIIMYEIIYYDYLLLLIKFISSYFILYIFSPLFFLFFSFYFVIYSFYICVYIKIKYYAFLNIYL